MNLKPIAPPRSWLLILLRLGFLNAALAFAIFSLHGLRPDIGIVTGRASFIIECLTLISCLTLAFASASLSAIPGRLHNSKTKVKASLLVFLLFLLNLGTHDGWIFRGMDNFGAGFTCGLFILICSIPPLLWGFREIKRGAVTEARVSAFFLAGGILSSATFVQHLLCPADDAPHLLFWHAFPLVLVVGLSTWIGPKLLRW